MVRTHTPYCANIFPVMNTGLLFMRNKKNPNTIVEVAISFSLDILPHYLEMVARAILFPISRFFTLALDIRHPTATCPSPPPFFF